MTPHLSTTKGAAAAALAMLLASSLGGCSSQSQSQGNAAPSASASVSASVSGEGGFGSTGEPEATEIETPELPKRPAAMDKDDEEGAIAAAEHFLRLSLYGAATGDWAEYDAMSMDTCTFCEDYRKDNEEALADYRGASMPDMEIHKQTVWPWEEDETKWRVDLVVEQGARFVRRQDGSSQKLEGSKTAIGLLLDPSAAWSVIEAEPFEVDKYDSLHAE